MEVYQREYDELISNKRPNLSAPGTRTTDLYYSYVNSSVEVLESTCDWSMKIALTSPIFGQNNQVNLPMSAFVGQVILHLRLPNVVADQTICRGWGLRMIKNIRFQFGSSASTPIYLTQQAVWHFLMAQADTEEKRSELFKLCGEEVLAPIIPLVGGSTPYLEAFIPLPVPFSTICEKLMFDTTLLGQPITIFIEFEGNPRAIYGGSATPPTSFQIAELLIRQQRLSDQSKSLRTILDANPDKMYSYPFIMAIGYETASIFQGVRESDNGQAVVQFNQFQNSDLLGIVFCVQAVTDLSPAGNNSPNPFHLDRITNIVVTYNGQSIAQLPGESYRAIASYMGKQGASYYKGSVILPGTVQPFDSDPVDEYLVFLDFALLRAACFPDHMDNTWRIPPGNVLQVAFNTTLGSAVSYRCFYTCFYNAIVTVQDGVSNIYTS